MLVSYLVDCVLSENIAFSGWGGAFYGVDSPYSQFVMLSSSFVNNRAYSSYFTQSHGGALMITSKVTVNISDCFFANNSALPYLHVVPLTYRYPIAVVAVAVTSKAAIPRHIPLCLCAIPLPL